jgi:NADPH2:quinone reductase
VQRTHEAVMELLAGGRIEPTIERTIGLDAVPAALTDLAARRTVGKILVRP